MTANRQLGLAACIALVIGNIVGSGIFLLPASLAPFGLNSVWGWLLTGAGAMFLALVFSSLSRAFPQAGGPQDYTRIAFGETTSFLVVWGYWISNWVGNAALATAATSYASALIPQITANPWAAPLATLAFVWLLTVLNARSLRAAHATQMVTVALKLVPLLAVVGLGLWLFATASPQLHNAHLASTPFKFGDVTAAAALTLWAMLGLESAAVVAGSVRDPERTIPRASLFGAAASVAVFVLACTTVQALIPADRLAQSHAPFADAVALFWGGKAGHAVALFAAISCLGALNGWLFVNAQLSAQMARGGLLPAVMARESAQGTPMFSLYVNSALTSVLVLLNYGKSVVAVFNFMILLSTTACLVMYLLCSLALLRTLQTGALTAARGRAAALACTGSLGTIYALWTLYGAGREAVLWGAALLFAGLPLYAWLRTQRRLVPAR